MKIKVWVDNGANIKSKKEFSLDVGDEEEWEALSDEEKDEIVWEAVCQHIEYGWDA